MTLGSLEVPDRSITRSNGLASHWSAIWPALILMLVAAWMRAPNLADRGYSLDELWSAEVASGRGSAHLFLPRNVVLNPPELMSLSGAPPWWHVWSHIQATHPPLYMIVLRFWEQLIGQSDFSARMLSVLASVAAVGIFYDTVRLLNGKGIAIWAALLMALAQPQIEYAREARNYALLMATGVLAINALVRIELLGMNRRRWFTLLLAVLATALNHYFAMGSLLALGAYVCIRFRAQKRNYTLLAFALAALIFIVGWGPFMWQQRHLFSTADPNTMFLRDYAPGHIFRAIRNFTLVPARFLAEPRDSMLSVSRVTALLYVLPLFFLRRRPDLLLWCLLLLSTVGLITAMDLVRNINELIYVRYTWLASPAIYCLLPAVFAIILQGRWIWHLVPAAAAVSCALSGPYSDHVYDTDTRLIAAELKPKIGPDDLLVFCAIGDLQWTAGAQYMIVSRYLHPVPCPIAFLNGPATGEVLDRARSSRYVFLFSDPGWVSQCFPGARVLGGRMYIGGGTWFQLDDSHR